MTTVTIADIRRAFDAAGVGFTNGVDRDYALVAEKWVGKFGSRFPYWQRQVLATISYEPEWNDCDDFAEDARYLARLLHRNTREKPDGALAFGLFKYQTDAGGWHAINVVACREDGRIYPVFFEPQTAQVVKLSPAELISGTADL